MRILLIFTLIILSGQVAWTQHDKPIAEKSQKEDLKEFTNSIFKYQTFVDGKVILKDSSVYAARLNYNRVLGQILCISKQGKPLPFAQPDIIDKIIIGKDTFQIYQNSFLEKYTHFPDINLYLKQNIKYIERDKSDNSGLPPIITNGSKLPYSNNDNDQSSQNVVLEKDALFKFINEYFLADNLMNVYPATKKSFYDLFPTHKTELKNYLQEHSINFNNLGHIEKLLQYLEEL